MRTTSAFLLFVLLACGALAAPEKERVALLEEVQGLERKIIEAEARLEGVGKFVGDEAGRVVRVHRVADLAMRRTNFIGPNLALQPAGAEVSETEPKFGKAEEGERLFLSPEQLIDLIRKRIRPAVWEADRSRRSRPWRSS